MADAMDSKSIARKGVGVRLPSLVPTDQALRRAGQALAEALLAEIVGDLHGAGQQMAELAARLRDDPPAALADELAFARLDRGGEQAQRSGFVLGVVGEALGLGSLIGRRAEDGLTWTLELLGRALARSGVRLVGRGAGRLRQDPGAGEGWELALLVALWLLRAAEQRGCGALVWTVRPVAGGYLLETSPRLDPARARELEALAACLALPGVRVQGARAPALALPARCVVEDEPRGVAR